MNRATRLMILCLAFSTGPCRGDASEFVELENGQGLRATISPAHGGELAGLEIEKDGVWHELIYRARDYSETGGWRGKSPFLWPAVGPTIDPAGAGRGFRADGVFYPMPPHGFARDHAWHVMERGRDEEGAYATLAFSSSAETRLHYPFDFTIHVRYRVSGETLSITYTVGAGPDNRAEMPFSIGNHVTFKAPLLGVGDAGEARFRSEFPDQLIRAEDKTFSGKVIASPYRGERSLSDLPRRSAVSLGGPPGPAELTVTDPSGLEVRIRHEASAEPEAPVIRFNLWADTEEGFFSPEPWLGTQNSLNNGAGLVRLAPGAEWRWNIEITPRWNDRPGTVKQEYFE